MPVKYVHTAELIEVVYDGERLVCKRCDRELELRSVAFLTRSSPNSAFEPWCPDCARILALWALTGMGEAPEEVGGEGPPEWA